MRREKILTMFSFLEQDSAGYTKNSKEVTKKSAVLLVRGYRAVESSVQAIQINKADCGK